MITNMKRSFYLSGLLLLVLGCGGSSNTVADTGSQDTGQGGGQNNDPNFNPNRTYQLKDLVTTELKIGEHKFTAWVMDTDAKRAEGMMHLKNEDFRDDQAMIFVFPQARELSFWMRNTLVDLDIAYLDKNKKIIRTGTMKALDETGFPSAGAAQYAVEFRAGLLKKKAIGKGMTVEFPDTVVARD